MTPILFATDSDEDQLLEIYIHLEKKISNILVHGTGDMGDYRKRLMVDNFLKMIEKSKSEDVKCFPLVTKEDLGKLKLDQLTMIMRNYQMFHNGFVGNRKKKSDIIQFITRTQSNFYQYTGNLVTLNIENIERELCIDG